MTRKRTPITVRAVEITERSYEARIDALGRMLGAAHEELAIAEAQRTALISVLSELIAYVRNTGGFMFAEEQATLRHAMAVLAEVQRR